VSIRENFLWFFYVKMRERGGVWAFGQNYILKKKSLWMVNLMRLPLRKLLCYFLSNACDPHQPQKTTFQGVYKFFLSIFFFIVLEMSSSNLWCDFRVPFFISPFLSLLYANFLCFLISPCSSIFISVHLDYGWNRIFFYVYHQF